MTMLLFLIMVVSGGSAFADILPTPPMPFPTPLHRIGFEIFAEVAGAIAVGGLVLKQMIAKYEKMKRSNEQEVRNEQWSSGDGRTVSCGGEFVRDAKGVSTRWHELGSEERQRFESKLTDELQTFESAYAKSSVNWLRDPGLPNQWLAKRDEWWRQKCQELVFSVLLQDDELRGRLKGVPIEWILSRMDKPTKRTWTEWTIWQFVRLIEGFVKFTVAVIVFGIDCVGRVCSSDYRQALKRGMNSGFWERRMLRNRFRFGVFLIYLSGVIAMASGAVGVEASCATAKVFKVVFYPLLFLTGCFAFVFVSMAAFAEISQWYRSRKLRKIVCRREKLLADYHGETEWRVVVPEDSLLIDGFAVAGIGGACDAALRLNYAGVALHHAEIYFDKTYHALGGDGFVLRGQGRFWICEHVKGRLPKKEKVVYLSAGRMICVGPYAILKVVSVPSGKDNAFVFELVDGKRQVEKTAKISQPGTSTGRLSRQVSHLLSW